MAITAKPTTAIESIGATGRDFATVAAWEATLPANITATGTNEVRIGEMHDDADFTEVGTELFGIASDSNHFVTLRAASDKEYSGVEDGGVVWKPTSGSGFLLRQRILHAVISGIEFAGNGVGYGGSGTLVGLLNIPNNGANNTHVHRCAFHHNTNGPGVLLGGGGADGTIFESCLAYDNGEEGFAAGTASTPMFVVRCGAYGNAGAGIRGFSVQSAFIWDSWSLDNTGVDVIGFSVAINGHGYNAISDTSFSGGSSNGVGILESQVTANLGFTNVAARNFKLTAGSALLLKGGPIGGSGIYTGTINSVRVSLGSDVVGTRFPGLNEAESYDIGPHQLSHEQDITAPSAPTVT